MIQKTQKQIHFLIRHVTHCFRLGSVTKTLIYLIYLIISGFVFVVCPSRTIFGMEEGAHVHLEGWKHGNREVRLNMVYTQ